MPRRLKQKFVNILLPLALLGLLIVFRNAPPLSAVRSFLIFFTSPVASAGSAVARQIRAFADPDTIERELHSRLAVAEALVETLKQDNERLHHALEFREQRRVSTKGGRVLALFHELGREHIIIDQGLQSGIEAGNAVIDAYGAFVGVVSEITSHTAKVGIASNIGQVHEVRVVPLGIKAFAKGVGNRTFVVELIPQDTPLTSGDILVIAGTGETNSHAIGEVTRISAVAVGAFKEVFATLLVRPENLREVFVITKENDF